MNSQNKLLSPESNIEGGIIFARVSLLSLHVYDATTYAIRIFEGAYIVPTALGSWDKLPSQWEELFDHLRLLYCGLEETDT